MVGIAVIAVFALGIMLVWRKAACANARCNGAVGTKHPSGWKTGRERCIPAAVFVLAFLVRILAAAWYKGHEMDMNCFLAWGDMVYEDGFAGFYFSDVFTDYPPGYIYILYVTGWLRSVLGISVQSTLSIVMTKIPAILADLATGWLVYRTALKKFTGKGALWLSSAYLFCPAVFLDSGVWGQTDGVFTFFVALMIFLLTEKRLIPSYFVFALAVLIKPQSLMFGPVLLFGIIDQVVLDNFSGKRFLKNLGFGLLAIGMLVLLMMPFDLGAAVSQYGDTLGSYEYASVNAYNFWTLLGKNWASQYDVWLGISCRAFGAAAVVLAAAAAAWFHFRCKKAEGCYYFSGAFFIACVFTFSVRMHERYLFPAMALLLLAYALRPKKEIFYGYALTALVAFLNMAHVLFFYDSGDYDPGNPVMYGISCLVLLLFFYLVSLAFRCFGRPAREEEEARVFLAEAKACGEEFASGEEEGAWEPVCPSARRSGMTRRDFACMAAVTVSYAVIAFSGLGNLSAPRTEYVFDGLKAVVLDFGQEVALGQLHEFLGYENNPEYIVEYSHDNRTWDTRYGFENPMDGGNVFAWNTVELNLSCRYLKIAPADDFDSSMMEMVLTDPQGALLTPVNAGDYQALFDEQGEYQGRASNRNGTYFDEIYHARTAYEMIHGLYCYENTHPPLGKILISLGILMFGMCPFGWRFMGTLFGVLMLPVLYGFSKKFLEETWICTVVTVLFAFDFMHFVQTRVATIDVFVTLFIMLSYYFMYCYGQYSFYDTRLGETFVPLGLCGVAMGFGWAAKWTGMYASLGLAIFFFARMGKRYREYAYARKYPGGSSGGMEHRHITGCFRKNLVLTLLFCCVFFVAVPVLIYVLSYLPFQDGTDRSFLVKVVQAQKTMFLYHSNIDAVHPYGSSWWQWPIMYRPVFYYSGFVSDTVREGISAFGNPFVWWAGIPAFFYMVYRILAKRDKKAAFLVLGYLSQYLPWILVKRLTFIYHYFPSVPFVVMMVGYAMYLFCKGHPSRKKWVYVYTALSVAAFGMFYPVQSGMPVSVDYVEHWLRWFPSWVLL